MATIVLALLAGCASGTLASGQAETAATARPNVLLILVDDLKPGLRGYGDRTAMSPNIDRLTQRRTTFTAAYARGCTIMVAQVGEMGCDPAPVRSRGDSET